MTTSYDYAGDETLACLPLALRQRMVAVQQARIDAGHTARNGVTYRTREKREFVDAVLDWHDAGKPRDGLTALRAREACLRDGGLF
jgi:Arc/MetJ family transcription regulator